MFINRKSLIIEYFLTFSVTIVILLLVQHYFGFYPEDHTESELSVHHNGIFLNYPVTLFNNWNVFTWITYIIVWLKNLYPNVNVHAWLMLLCMVSAITNYTITLICSVHMDVNSNALYKKVLILLLIISVIHQDIFFTQYIKNAFHLIASGLLLYNTRTSKSVSFFAIISVLIGVMLRYESFFIVVLFLSILFLILNKPSPYSIWKLFKKNIKFVSFLFMTILFSSFNYTKSDKLYRPYHNPINTIADFRYNTLDTNSFTAIENAKLNMIRGYYFNDTSYLGIKTINKLGIIGISRDPIDVFAKIDLGYSIKRGIHDFKHFLKNTWKFQIIYLMLIIILAWKSVRNLKNFLLGALFLYFTILSMSCYMDIQHRFVYPLYTILIVIILLHIKVQYRNLSFVLLISLFLNSYNIYFPLKSLYNYRKQIDTKIQQIERSGNYKIFWDFHSWNILNMPTMKNFPIYKTGRDFCMDFPFGFALEAFSDYNKKYLGTSEWYHIIDGTINNKTIIYFYQFNHLNTQIEYFNLLYKRHVKMIKLEGIFCNPINPSERYQLFQLIEE